MLEFNLSISSDGRFAKLDFGAGEKLEAILTAQDVEQLINILSNARGKMLPRVSQVKSPLDSQAPYTDAISPQTDVGRLSAGQVLLSVAYTGLGWRTAQLDPDEAIDLAKSLVVASKGPA